MSGTAYIGKIAAIVTANTAGLSKNLASGAKEVTSFGLSMEGTIKRATTNAGNSFRNIFTPLQKLTQALAQAERLKFKGFEAGNAQAAIKKMEQLASAAMLVAKPLEDVQQRFQKLSLGQQAGLVNELERAQGAAIALKAAIDAGLGSVDSKAATAERALKRVTLALGRAEEAGRMVAQMPTGNELAFANPGTAGRLAAAAAASKAAADAPASARMADPMIARLVGQSRKVSQDVVDAMSRVAGGGGAAASADLAKFEAQLDRITARLNRRLALQVDAKEAQDAVADLTKRVDAFRQKANFSLTGRAQNFDQAREEVNRLLNDVKKLEAAQQGAVGKRVARLGRLVEKEDVNDLARIQQEIEKIDADIAKKLKVTLDDAEAKQKADDLIARKNKLKEDIAFSVTGNVQNFAQAKQEAGRLFAEMGKLNPAQQANVGKRLMKLDSLISSGDPAKLAQIQSLIRLINADIGRKQKFNLRAEEAKKEADSLRASLRSLRQDANFRITGKVQNMEQAKGEITRLIGLLNQLDAAKKKQAQTAINTAISGLMRPGADVGAVIDRLRGRLDKLGVKGTGDVGRMGMDKFTLGMNQAIFAVDDFMSSTGGMEQKLRAVSNNITQLGFVVGGTTGLMIGLGAVMAGQLAVGFVKWINNGRTAEDQTKALNDAIAKQISLVEELAQAFARLGGEIVGRGFSAGAKEAQKFRNEMEGIEKKQRELRESRIAEFDPDVQKARGDQARIKRELETETDPGRRVALANELRSARAAERAATRRAVDAPAPTPAQLEATMLGTVRANEFLEGGRMTARSEQQAAARREKISADVAAANGDPFEMRRILEERMREREEVARKPLTAMGFEENPEIMRAREDVALLKRAILALEGPLHAAADALENEFLRALNGVSYDLENAQQQMAEAIKAGIPEAVRMQGTLDKLNSEIEAAFNAIRDAKENEDLTPDERKKAVEEQEKKVEASRAARDAALIRADQINYSRIVDPQRLMDTRLGNARQNLSDSGLDSGRLARRMRDIDARRQEIESRINRPDTDPLTKNILSGGLEALNAEAKALEVATLAVRTFTEALNRAAQEVKANLGSAQQRADETRRADIARSTPQTQADRKRAQDDLDRQRKLARDAEVAQQNARAEIEERMETGQGPMGAQFARMKEIDEALAAGNLSAKEQAELRAERRRLEEQVQPEVDRINRQAEATAEASTREEENRKSRERGLELAKSPEQRAREEAAQKIADLKAANAPQEAINRNMREMAQQVAPMVMGFREERANALLQGPSRAALNVSDVNTMEGSRELNRLLRGDDPAKDVNLVELKKQSDLLQALLDEAKNQGVVVDMR